MTIRLGKLTISLGWSACANTQTTTERPATGAQSVAGLPPPHPLAELRKPLLKLGPGGTYRRVLSGEEPVGEIVDHLL